MAQAKVSAFYPTRKRACTSKTVKSNNVILSDKYFNDVYNDTKSEGNPVSVTNILQKNDSKTKRTKRPEKTVTSSGATGTTEQTRPSTSDQCESHPEIRLQHSSLTQDDPKVKVKKPVKKNVKSNTRTKARNRSNASSEVSSPDIRSAFLIQLEKESTNCSEIKEKTYTKSLKSSRQHSKNSKSCFSFCSSQQGNESEHQENSIHKAPKRTASDSNDKVVKPGKKRRRFQSKPQSNAQNTLTLDNIDVPFSAERNSDDNLEKCNSPDLKIISRQDTPLEADEMRNVIKTDDCVSGKVNFSQNVHNDNLSADITVMEKNCILGVLQNIEESSTNKTCVTSTSSHVVNNVSSINHQLSSQVECTSAKSKLLKSSNITELQDKLSKVSSALSKLNSFNQNKCKISSAISAITEKSQSRDSDVVPENMKAVPAYKRFHSLATSGVPTLNLPYKYKVLSEIFRCSDTVVSMLHNRKEICTFDKLKYSVQDMAKRTFNKLHLGQIKTVFPSAYNISQEKGLSAFISTKSQPSQFQMVVAPNFKYKQDLEGVLSQSGNLSFLENNVNMSQRPCRNSFQLMNPSCLIERKNIFLSNLLTMAKKYHQEFLTALNPPINLPEDRITRWHPKFALDDVPDIPPAPLPEPPDQYKCNSAMDVLNKVRGTVGEKIEKALQSVAESHSSVSDKSEILKAETKSTVTSGVLKGICNDLLQKIRAKESSRIVQEITKTPEAKKRQEMLERIPEIIRILRIYFISERKAAVSIQDAVQKVADSYHSAITPEDVKEHLQLISEIFPNWLSVINISKGRFLRIDKNQDINVLLQNISKL